MRFLRFAMRRSSYRYFYDRTIHFVLPPNYFPPYFIELANRVLVIRTAMKLRAEELENVIFTGVRCTISFPVSSGVRDAIRKIPGKGERCFLLQNLQMSLGITWPPILSWEKDVRGV
jgi:hypothetical protein